MPKYSVPVWFDFNAEDLRDAWDKMHKILRDAESVDQLPDYIIDEPVELLEDTQY